MEKRYVQAELEPAEYVALKRAAAAQKVPIKEFVRDSIRARVRQTAWKDDPLWSIIGIAKRTGRRTNDAEEHDKILYGWTKR